jgi:transcriptional regulator GlxA family with amidase domain
MHYYSTASLAVIACTFLVPCLTSPLQPPITNTSTLPIHYGLVVFPHFQALDIFGPMDLLNSLFMMYSNVTTSPSLSVLSRNMDPVTSAMMPGAFGQEILPTTTFKQYMCERAPTNDTHLESCISTNVNMSAEKSAIDVLIVPGGGGTRRDMSEEIAFIAAAFPRLKYIISICTGASLLSRAGVLAGRRATTNKRSWAWATSHGDNITWVPTARWVQDGNVFSSSGVSAGIDAMYAFVGSVYGQEVAKYMSLSLEYTRVVHWDDDPFAAVWDVPGAK